MSYFINTFSSSFKYDLKELFEYNNEYMKKFLFRIQDYINNNEEENIKNYQGLKKFLGKKRKLVEEEEEEINKKNKTELDKNSLEKEKISKVDIEKEEKKKYFKKEIEKKDISIFIDDNKDFKLRLKKNNKIETLTIYNEPISIIEIYEQNSININLINDDITFTKKYENLKKYDFKSYSLNDTLGIISSKDINGNEEITSFKIQNENFKLYLCILKSIIPNIEDNDLELKNIYPKEEMDSDGNIYPVKNISKIFFYYFNINLELQNKYKYIESINREKLFKILSNFFSRNIKNILIIFGSKGIGKTTSLIRFAFKKTYNIFYFNLEAFNKYKNDDIQVKELKIQLNKLFKDFEDLDIESKIKTEIENYIDYIKQVNVDCLEFIYNIIKLFLKFVNKLDINGISQFGFIIDQYSTEFKTNSINNIYKIIELIRTSNKIKLIICPTINNNFSKGQMDYLFNETLNINKNKNIDIYYFQDLIGKNEMINNILKDEKEEYLSFMEEAGYIPKLFYDSKLSDIKTYKNYLKTNLKNNLDEYLINTNDNIKNNTELLTLIDFIRSERLISSFEFKNNISKFPLKYLKLIKYKINKEIIQEFSKQFNLNAEQNILLKYFSFLFSMCNAKKYDIIITNYFNVEERDIKGYLNNYFEKDTNSFDIFGNYYEKFILNNSKFVQSNLKQDTIFLYKLEFSLFLFEDVIYEYLYKNLQKEYNFYINILDKGANGGFFEILVDYYIKSTKSFIVDGIKQIFYIPSIVPHNYSINYYSSKRKKNDKFIEFKLKEKNEQKKINKKKIKQENINQENNNQQNIKQQNINQQNINQQNIIQENIIQENIIQENQENNNQENLNQENLNQESLNKENQENINRDNINQENNNQENNNQENNNQENLNQENINRDNMNQENINQENLIQENINQENLIQEKKNQENIKNKKKVIPFENTYIKQTIYNSKYYDMIILKKSPKSTNSKTFNLIAIQVSIRKDHNKRMSKDEHELILGIVKKNIENEFDIIIDEAYFIYVLSEKNQKIEDNETKKDCDKNGISYIGFDIELIKDNFKNKNDKYLIDLSKAFITNSFPIHNNASLLIYQKNETFEYSLLKQLINSNLKKSKQIENGDFDIIKKLIKNKHDQKDIDEKQFQYFNLTTKNKIGYYINDFLTEFCFLITDIKTSKFNEEINYNCLFFLGKTYELTKFNIIKSSKIKNNSKIKFVYSKIPLEIIQNI